MARARAASSGISVPLYEFLVAGGFALLVGNYLAWGRDMLDWLDVVAALIAGTAMLLFLGWVTREPS